MNILNDRLIYDHELSSYKTNTRNGKNILKYPIKNLFFIFIYVSRNNRKPSMNSHELFLFKNNSRFPHFPCLINIYLDLMLIKIKFD